MSSAAAIVLAAGQSKRMGAFKPFLPFGVSSVIKATIQYLEKGGCDPIVVVAGHRADELQQHLAEEDVTVVLNDHPESEMGVSIAIGVNALSADTRAVLITPADQPAVSPSLVSQLIQEWKLGASLIIPTWQGHGGHPVLVDLHYRDQLRQLDQEGGLKGFFTAHEKQVLRLAVDDPYIARDMDTWDDYIRLHRDVVKPRASEAHLMHSNESSDPNI